MGVDEKLRALAHPARRAMLRLAWDAERSSSEIAEAVALSRPAASQHLKVLRDAGLVHVRVDGNQRLYRVDLDRLAEVRSQLEGFWAERLGHLASTIAAGERRR
jgi:DNA-binding transcriptional ArsR family regulator